MSAIEVLPARPAPVRAGVVVTGTEVLSGQVADRNGPWLSERLREQGAEVTHIVVVGDRPDDLADALEFLAVAGADLVVTSGGLGPTADDLTADVVARFAGRESSHDPALEERIAERLRAARPGADVDSSAARAGIRKQAHVPVGAEVLEPVGTAPGLVVPPGDEEGPTIVVLPGPPGELQGMWPSALANPLVGRVLAPGRPPLVRTVRMFGVGEPAIAETLREIAVAGDVRLDRLEVTTCLRRGELEVVTVLDPAAEPDYLALEAALLARHADGIFSTDGSTVDDLVRAALLAGSGRTVATAESCTAGLLAGRLTEPPGSSAYVLGGLVVYSNAAKTSLAHVPPELIARHGAVSPEVAAALADGARTALGADFGVGITGIAGPGGGSEAKPVGTVCLSVCEHGGARVDRTVHLPGGRGAVRERTTTVAMHMLLALLRG